MIIFNGLLPVVVAHIIQGHPVGLAVESNTSLTFADGALR
jgi:hypothetical protein